MGQQQNQIFKTTYDHKNMPLQLYKIIQLQKNGNLLLKHKKTGDQFLLRTFTSYQEDQIAGFNRLLVKRQKIKCTHLLSIAQVHQKEEKNICSILKKIYILIQYPFKNLEEEIIERANDKQGPRYFTENQLLSILYSCCIGLKTLYKNNFTHEALTLQQIMVDRSGLIKISDPILLGKQKNYIACMKNIQIDIQDQQLKQTLQQKKKQDKFFIQDEDKKYYHLSPEIMNFLDDFNFFYYQKQRSDVFILACLILQACLLKKFELYNAQAKQQNLSILPLLLKQIKIRSQRRDKGYNHYSEVFIQILSGMLNLQPKLRPNFSQIIDKIESYNQVSTTFIQQLKSTNTKQRNTVKLSQISNFNNQKLSNNKKIFQYQNTINNRYSCSGYQAVTSDSFPFSSIPQQFSPGQKNINAFNYQRIQNGVISNKNKYLNRNHNNSDTKQPKIKQFDAQQSAEKEFREFKKIQIINKNKNNSRDSNHISQVNDSFASNQNSQRKRVYSNVITDQIHSKNLSYQQNNNFKKFQLSHPFFSTPHPINNNQNNRNPQMVNIGSIQINFNHHSNTPYSTAHPPSNSLSNFSAKTFKTNHKNSNINPNSFQSENKRAFSIDQKNYKNNFNSSNNGQSYFMQSQKFIKENSNCFSNRQHTNSVNNKQMKRPSRPIYSHDIPQISQLLAKINIQKNLSNLYVPSKLQQIYRHDHSYSQRSHQKSFSKHNMTSSQRADSVNVLEKQSLKAQSPQPFNQIQQLLVCKKSQSSKNVKRNSFSNSSQCNFNQNQKKENQKYQKIQKDSKSSKQKQNTITDKIIRTSSKQQLIQQQIQTPTISAYNSNQYNKSLQLTKKIQNLDNHSLEISRSNTMTQQQSLQKILSKSKQIASPPHLHRQGSLSNQSSKKEISDIIQQPQSKQNSHVELQRQIQSLRKQRQNYSSNQETTQKRINQMNQKQLEELDIIQCESDQLNQSSSGTSISMGIRKYINPGMSILQVNQQNQMMMNSQNGSFSTSIQKQFKKTNKIENLVENQSKQIINQNINVIRNMNKIKSPDKKSNSQKDFSYNYSHSDFQNKNQVFFSPTLQRTQQNKYLTPLSNMQSSIRKNLMIDLSKISPIQQSKNNFVIQNLQGGGKYEGFKLNGKKNGQGRLFFKDGGYYQGQWVQNKMTGFGKLYYDSGNVAYQGFWQDDEFSGKGRVFNDSPQSFPGSFQGLDFGQLKDKWIFYEGFFQKDAKHGRGIIKLTNGQIFDGHFFYDVIEGLGIFYKIDGTVLSGFWRENVYVGEQNQQIQ